MDELINFFTMFKLKKKPKVFCIGQNKTGTTSLERVLKDEGFIIGNQHKGESMLINYLKRDFKSIAEFCNTAEAFQDVPFSLPFLYVYLDQTFPKSKFILTVRDNEDQWYESITKFHKKITTSELFAPSYQELEAFDYHEKGWLLKYMSIYNTTKDNLYDENSLKLFYNNHNQQVIDYFKDKNNLLVLNISQPESYSKLAEFLNLSKKDGNFPWLNKTYK